MVRRLALPLLLLPLLLQAQGILTPLQCAPRAGLAPKGVDTVEVQLPFFDDFSDYQGAPRPALWLTQDAFINADYAPLPPTVGMATLDALDACGQLHPTATTSLFSADTLASQPIRLDSLFAPVRRRLTPADSVILSFYYLPGGGTGQQWELLGEAPDAEDSLILEFLDPEADEWHMVWATGGTCVDSLLARTGHAWQYVCVPVTEGAYFHRRFQFRFRNYASLYASPQAGLPGNTDQWNLDYILLDYNRHSGNRTARDVAFVEKAPTLLRHFQAMPARQFQSDDMADRAPLVITNLYNQALTTSYVYNVYSEEGSLVYHYDGGHENAPAFWPDEQYQEAPAHARPPVAFAYPVYGQKQTFTVEHIVTEGIAGDGRKANDTLRFAQRFADYYAYDDGVPENGYGITAVGHIACRFPIRQPDTLTAIDLYFNATRNHENESVRFYLAVWSCQEGRPGSLLLRDAVQQRVAIDGLNRYHRYLLQTPIVLTDSVFIGIMQQSAGYINLGFDRSNDVCDRIYTKTSSDGWRQSFHPGALMLRPCFGKSGQVGIGEISGDEARPVSTEMYDLLGRRVACPEGQKPSRAGVYIQHTLMSDGQIITQKIIVK